MIVKGLFIILITHIITDMTVIIATKIVADKNYPDSAISSASPILKS